MAKLNCWDFMLCKKGPEREDGNETEACPAATDASCDGINKGVNAGRICWAVAGAFCGDMIKDKFAQDPVACMSCNFFKMVQQEEGANFMLLKADRNTHH